MKPVCKDLIEVETVPQELLENLGFGKHRPRSGGQYFVVVRRPGSLAG